jgi:hypothetical protein
LLPPARFPTPHRLLAPNHQRNAPQRELRAPVKEENDEDEDEGEVEVEGEEEEEEEEMSVSQYT